MEYIYVIYDSTLHRQTWYIFTAPEKVALPVHKILSQVASEDLLSPILCTVDDYVRGSALLSAVLAALIHTGDDPLVPFSEWEWPPAAYSILREIKTHEGARACYWRRVKTTSDEPLFKHGSHTWLTVSRGYCTITNEIK